MWGKSHFWGEQSSLEHPQQILQKIKGLQVQYMYKNEKVCSVKPGTHKNLLFGPNKSGKIQGGRILYIYIYISYVYILIYIYILFDVFGIYRQPEQLVMLWWKFIVKSLKITKYNMHVLIAKHSSCFLRTQNCNLSRDTGKKKNVSKSSWVFFKRDASKDLLLMG